MANNTKNLIKQFKTKPPKLTAFGGMIIPNHSGDHSAGKTKAPEVDNALVNKKYVDDEIAGIPLHDPLTLGLMPNGLTLTNQELGIEIASSTTPGAMDTTQVEKLDGIETGAEVNNISDANATDLTDAGDSALHYHSADRARAVHSGTQPASTISDFDTEVGNHADVAANTSARHTQNTDTILDSGGANQITAAQAKSAYTHVSNNGTDHSYINQDVSTAGTPTFTAAYSNNGSGQGNFGYNGAYYLSMRAGTWYINQNGWTYEFATSYFAPYTTGALSLGSAAKKWNGGYLSGTLASTAEINTSNYFKGNYKSSDGSIGANLTRTFYASATSGGLPTVRNTITIKDGLIISWTQV